MFRFRRNFFELQQRKKSFLQNIFGFGVTESKRASVKNQLRRFRIVKPLAPAKFSFPDHISSFNRHRSGPVRMKILDLNRPFSGRPAR